MREVVDLNSDLGEGGEHDEAILELVTSANIACGFHAGDPASVFGSICAAKEWGVATGAHPSLADRENFGRTEREVSASEVFTLVTYQIGAFRALCAAAGTEMNHVKPHGALYNMAACNQALAQAIVHAVLAVDTRLILFVPARSALEIAAVELELPTTREVFADRNYMPDGSLVPRSRPDALLRNPVEAAERVVRMLREGVVRAVDGSDVPIEVETICVHGDTPEAVGFVRELRRRLESERVTIAPPRRRR